MHSQPSVVLHSPQQVELGGARDRGMDMVVRKADVYLLREAVWVLWHFVWVFQRIW